MANVNELGIDLLSSVTCMVFIKVWRLLKIYVAVYSFLMHVLYYYTNIGLRQPICIC